MSHTGVGCSWRGDRSIIDSDGSTWDDHPGCPEFKDRGKKKFLMSTPLFGLTASKSARADRRAANAERRRVERELASFVSESERAELSAILERSADELGVPVYELISERVLAAA